MERKKYMIKNVGLLTISNFSSKILVFLLVPLYTGLLSTEEYGEYELVSTTIQLLVPLLSINIFEAVMRFLMDKKDQEQVLSIAIKHIVIAALIFGWGIIVNYIWGIYKPIQKYSLFIFLYFFSAMLNQFAMQLARGFEAVLYIAVAGVLGTLSTVVLNIICLLNLKWGLKGFYIAYIVGQLIPAIYIFKKVKICKYLKFKTNGVLRNEMMRYSVPMIANNIGWWVNNVSDRYIVTAFCGMAVNGIYSVSYKIPTILTIFQQIVIQAWQISAIKERNAEDSKIFYGKMLVFLNCMICFVCTILIASSKIIASVLYAKNFYDAWKYVPFLLVSGVINSASGILGPILSANKNSTALGKSAFYGALVNFILNIILVGLIGAQGAAVATAISSYVIYHCRLRYVQNSIVIDKYFRIPISWLLLTVQAILLICTNYYSLQGLIFIAIIILFLPEICLIWNYSLKMIGEKVRDLD